MLFRCKNCGGNVVYSPEHNKMFCPHCDGIDSEEKTVSVNKTECINCGAPMDIGEYNCTCKCEYCGSYMILDDRVDGNYRPHLILPFKIGKNRAVERMKEEFKHRIFVPDSFLSEATLEKMKGIYVPFWMYDYTVRYDYVGKGIKVRRWTSGNTEYTETSFYRVTRNMDIDFDGIPVDASIETPDDTMDLIEPYDYQQLEGFAEEYMSGFYGEIYSKSAEELEVRAKEKAAKNADILLRETIIGYDTVEHEGSNLDLRGSGVNYVLLPVWRYIYKYKDVDYEFYVNGQTGKIIGTTPISKKKIWAYGGTVFAALWMALSLLIHIVEVM